MTQLIGFEDERIVGLRVDGKVSDDDFERVVGVIEDRLERHERLRIYVELVSFSGMPPETFFKDFTFGLKHWRRFDREAVVSDKPWLQKLAGAADKLLPGIEVKGFSFAERDAARAWIQDGS